MSENPWNFQNKWHGAISHERFQVEVDTNILGTFFRQGILITNWQSDFSLWFHSRSETCQNWVIEFVTLCWEQVVHGKSIKYPLWQLDTTGIDCSTHTIWKILFQSKSDDFRELTGNDKRTLVLVCVILD